MAAVVSRVARPLIGAQLPSVQDTGCLYKHIFMLYAGRYQRYLHFTIPHKYEHTNTDTDTPYDQQAESSKQ